MTTLRYKASRHSRKGIEASSPTPFTCARLRLAASLRRAFSLIEVLLAIFILGVGVISIAALFPAGIAQQRLSVDDIVGPTVANNAMGIIQSKIRAQDFGMVEDFGFTSRTIPGDWGWSRPAFYFVNTPMPGLGNLAILAGSVSIFGRTSQGAATNTEIPWSAALYGNNINTPPPKPFVITQRERYYPMGSYNAIGGDAPKPQYVWDCMFRRFEGKIQVAIFVYRVTVPGGSAASYVVAPNATNAGVPPLPVSLDLTIAGTPTYAPWDVGGLDANPLTLDDNTMVRGNPGGTAYNADDARQAWQEPRQWLLDQNNNVHRVLAHSRLDDLDGNPLRVELVRAVPSMPNLANPALGAKSPFFLPGANPSIDDVVTNIWYIPFSDSKGLTLTPVYVTVKEL